MNESSSTPLPASDRPRRPLRALAIGVPASLLVLLPALAVILPPIVITNRIGGGEALRDLLAEETARGRLEEISACLPLWRIAGGGVEGDEDSYDFHFDFAPGAGFSGSTKRAHGQVYRLSYRLSPAPEGGGYEVVERDEGYGSAPVDLARPVAPAPRAIRMLHYSLSDSAVFGSLRSRLDGSSPDPLVDLTLVPSSSEGLEPTDPGRDMILRFHWRAPEGHSDSETEAWRVRGDPQLSTFTAEPWTGTAR